MLIKMSEVNFRVPGGPGMVTPIEHFHRKTTYARAKSKRGHESRLPSRGLQAPRSKSYTSEWRFEQHGEQDF